LERRFIAFPKSAQGIVAGQIHPLEVGNSGFRTQLAGYLPMSALSQKQTYAVQKGMSALPPIATAKADSPALVRWGCSDGEGSENRTAKQGLDDWTDWLW